MPLFGYANARHESTDTNDPLLCSALHLRSASPLMIISLDLFCIDPPTCRLLRAAVSKHTAIAESRILISCTHTHSGPVTIQQMSWSTQPGFAAVDPDYLSFLENSVVTAASKAAATSAPAEVAWTTADVAGIGGNRFATDGPTDPEVGILCVRNLDTARLIAALVVYGMQPDVLRAESTALSADFPHFVRQELSKQTEGDSVTIYCTGPCADQSTYAHTKGHSPQDAAELGKKLGAIVAERIKSIPNDEYHKEVVLSGKNRAVDVSLRQFPPAFQGKLKWGDACARLEQLQSGDASPGQLQAAEAAVQETKGAVALTTLHASGQLAAVIKEYQPIEVQVVKIGGLLLAGLPGEPCAGHGLSIKSKVSGPVFPIAFANGDLQGYVAESAAGPHGPRSFVISPETGNRIVDTATTLCGELSDPA